MLLIRRTNGDRCAHIGLSKYASGNSDKKKRYKKLSRVESAVIPLSFVWLFLFVYTAKLWLARSPDLPKKIPCKLNARVFEQETTKRKNPNEQLKMREQHLAFARGNNTHIQPAWRIWWIFFRHLYSVQRCQTPPMSTRWMWNIELLCNATGVRTVERIQN